MNTWEEDDGLDEDYFGVIKKQKKRGENLMTYDISYWQYGCPDSTAEITPLEAEKLVVDILTSTCKIIE